MLFCFFQMNWNLEPKKDVKAPAFLLLMSHTSKQAEETSLIFIVYVVEFQFAYIFIET